MGISLGLTISAERVLSDGRAVYRMSHVKLLIWGG